MTPETGKRIVDYLLDLYEQNTSDFVNQDTKAVVLDFIGGEPLLEAPLIERVCDYWFEQCWKRNIPLAPFTRISFATNGQLWFSPEAQHLFEKYHEMMSVTVSIDGVQELHDMYRLDEHGNGSFAKAWEAFQDSKKYGWNGSTKMTFVPGSFKYIADSIIMMLNEGCDSIACNYAYEPLYNPSDGYVLYSQLKIAANYIVILIMAVLSVVAIRFGYKALLIEWAIDAISKAEKEFVGTKLGEARLAVVVSWLREKVPAPVRFLVTDDLIRKAVQTAFDAAKSGLEVLKNA